MKQILRRNRSFILPYIFVIMVCLILLLLYSKTELHIISNEANSPFLDFFFKYATNLGDGAIIAILFIALLFVEYRYAFAFLAGSLATSVVINLFKKVILGDIYRPSKYFELYETYQLHFVEGVNLHSLHSFPSGHTGTAFNVFFMLALLVKNNTLKLTFFVIACLVGYSRVYISQHFLVDITVGSFLGILFILLFYFWFEKSEKNWLNKSMIRR